MKQDLDEHKKSLAAPTLMLVIPASQVSGESYTFSYAMLLKVEFSFPPLGRVADETVSGSVSR